MDLGTICSDEEVKVTVGTIFLSTEPLESPSTLILLIWYLMLDLDIEGPSVQRILETSAMPFVALPVWQVS